MSAFAAASAATAPFLSPNQTTTSTVTNHRNPRLLLYPSKPLTVKSLRPITKTQVSSKPISTPEIEPKNLTSEAAQERIFFDGGTHYGELIANLLLGLTLLWLPLTLAAVSRAFFLRYRFTNLRVTVISGLTGQDRSDFSYKVIKDVQVVPRAFGAWGDIIITLKDGTKVDLRSVPRFREIAKYCLAMAQKPVVLKETKPKGFL